MKNIILFLNKHAIKLKFVGAFLLFTSWISQNYLFNKWNSKVEKIYKLYYEEKFLEAARDENGIARLMLPLINQKEDFQSAKIICHFNANYINAIIGEAGVTKLLLLFHEPEIADSFDIKSSMVVGNIQDSVKIYNQNLNTQKIANYALKVQYWENSQLQPYLRKISQDSHSFENKSNFWNKIFLIAYISGSIFIGMPVLTKHCKTKSKIMNPHAHKKTR